MDPFTIATIASAGMNVLNQDEAQKKRDLSVRRRAGVQPIQQQDSGLGSVLGLGSAIGGAMGGGAPTGGSGPSMGPVNRALDSRGQMQAFQSAQGALQTAPPDLRETLGPIFADALKRQSRGGY